MEMQFFVRPGDEMKWYKYWKEFRMKWHESLGMGKQNYRFRSRNISTLRYATDIQFNFPPPPPPPQN